MPRSSRRRALAALAALALLAAPAARGAQERDPVDPPASAAAAVAPEAAPPKARRAGVRERIVAAARRLVGRPFHGDCSSFVLSLLRGAGIRPTLPPARSRSESLWWAARAIERARPGDLAFFHDTYDRNHDGLANDPYTHVALVEAVDGPAITLLHRGITGIERIRMDLAHPADPDANDAVRIARAADPPGTRVLAGELFAGFGAVAR